jgi:coniferyl-aldehyde dehydrogenase
MNETFRLPWYADLVEQHIERLAALDTLDAGKLLIRRAAALLRQSAADKVHGAMLKMFFKVAPALAAGCVVVIKPAEQVLRSLRIWTWIRWASRVDGGWEAGHGGLGHCC